MSRGESLPFTLDFNAVSLQVFVEELLIVIVEVRKIAPLHRSSLRPI